MALRENKYSKTDSDDSNGTAFAKRGQRPLTDSNTSNHRGKYGRPTIATTSGPDLARCRSTSPQTQRSSRIQNPRAGDHTRPCLIDIQRAGPREPRNAERAPRPSTPASTPHRSDSARGLHTSTSRPNRSGPFPLTSSSTFSRAGIGPGSEWDEIRTHPGIGGR